MYTLSLCFISAACFSVLLQFQLFQIFPALVISGNVVMCWGVFYVMREA